MTYLLVFIAFLGLIILHEIGHFWAAKKFGVKVEEFGIFLPPRIYGKKVGETIYSINLLPFGAFVRIFGQDSRIQEEGSFNSKPIWQRAIILFAGVFAFWLVAFFIFTLIFAIGVDQNISDDLVIDNPKVQITGIAPGSPADDSEIMIGDTIYSLTYNNETIEVDKVIEVQEFILNNKGNEITLGIERGNEVLEKTVTPRVEYPISEGSLGVGLVRTAIVKSPLWKAPWEGLKASIETPVNIIKGWGYIISNAFKKEEATGISVVGPIGVVKMMNEAAKFSFNYFLQFVAMISIYLALFNLLPIPSLDGGRLVFLLIEKIKGGPVKEKLEQGITAVFFLLLIGMFFVIMFRDIVALF
jgi:regulator of sigma E protease